MGSPFSYSRWSGGDRCGELPEHPLDRRKVAAVDDPLAAVEDHHRHDFAAVALAPLPARRRIMTDVTADVRDTFLGEIPFHLGAIRSAGADIEHDGRKTRSCRAFPGSSHPRDENDHAGQEDEAHRRHAALQASPVRRGGVVAQTTLHGVFSLQSSG